ncbi:MAG: alkaline phosphatase [Methylophilaceae bacterium]|nr:alkaline phosphatase [Methylophilaceae bacterium]MDG1453857.1 alkaline phosphatase [Methylophilaceae bacterium]
MTNIIRLFIFIVFTISAVSAIAEDQNTWINDGKAALNAAKQLQPNNRKAKNVILFIGDGMGISTVTGSRIFEGQQRGVDGERNQLSFEKLPYLALSKTYSANQQTPDSAPTMTAIVAGVKTNDGVLALNQNVKRGETNLAVIQANQVQTILEKAEANGLATGIISTARITHATPAATYAHIPDRDWENDEMLPASAEKTGVKDIAVQLVEQGKQSAGDGIDVMLGGGRKNFLPMDVQDPENPKKRGNRHDGRNLIAEYMQQDGAAYVWNKAQFDAINPKKTKRLLGLFQPSHMHYEHDRAKDKAGEPSLAEMTTKAIDILSQREKGYFLMVEAARVDHASHAGNAYRSFSETVALSDAVKATLDKVDLSDTLIIVTADHSHSLTITGYPKRGNPILGKVIAPDETEPTLAKDGKPYTTVNFANGLGYHEHVEEAKDIRTGRIKDMSDVDTTDPDFHQEALVPLEHETHAAEDVAIFAGGPKAHLFHGVQEQSYIYYVMEDAFGFNQ